MRQHLQVLSTSNKTITPLPSLFTANDVRGVIHYLKKKPEGVTLGEAMLAIKKQVFESRKFEAYQSLGIIVSERDRFKLSQLGLDLADKMEPELNGFRGILNSLNAYRDVLAWAEEKKLGIIVHQDVAAYWREHHRDALGVSTEKMIEACANSFFQLCQAAGLGTHIVGKKGQPTRLRIDSDELRAFLLSDSIKWPREVYISDPAETFFEPDERLEPEDKESHSAHNDCLRKNTAKVFVSFNSGAQALSAQIQTMLDLADFISEMIERNDSDLLHAPDASRAIRSSGAGIIIVSADDYHRPTASEVVLKQNVQFEIVTSSVIFGQHLLLLWDKSLPLDDRFAHLNHLFYEHCELNWENGTKVMKQLKSFKLASVAHL